MKHRPCLTILLLAPVSITLWGCRNNDRQDTVIASAANPSHTWRATVILRQYFVDGKPDTSPTTYVLLDPDSGNPNYANGADFKDSQVALKASQCGALDVRWSQDRVLDVICKNCGLALSAVEEHSTAVGSIRVEYDGFPERSSWDPGPGAN
jgi:hypothetical protein